MYQMAGETPRSVEEAADLAEQLHAQMYGSEEQEPEEEEEIEDTPDSDDEQDESVDEDDDVPEDDDIAELKKFKNRYLSLKGKYEAEVPRLAAELREMKQAITQSAIQRTAPVQAEEEVNPLKKFSEEYGEDFVTDLQKLISLEAQKLVTPIQQQAQSVEETQIKAAQENFKNYLDAKVDDGKWRPLWEGKDPKFMEFLQKPDPSGLYTYGDLVQLYNDNWDADKLATVFNTYLDTKQTKTKRIEPNPQQDARIAPNRSNSQPSPKADTGKIWSQSDIVDFQRKDQQGKFSQEESKVLWDDLLSALSENRIRN
jgi:hypothetical protein